MRTIRPSDLTAEIKANALAGLPTMIWGGPGEGKSEIVYGVSKELNAKLFEIRANLFDPVDVRGGLKVVEQEDGTYRTRVRRARRLPRHQLPRHCNHLHR